jgi:hypothetical protein
MPLQDRLGVQLGVLRTEHGLQRQPGGPLRLQGERWRELRLLQWGSDVLGGMLRHGFKRQRRVRESVREHQPVRGRTVRERLDHPDVLRLHLVRRGLRAVSLERSPRRIP